MKFTGERFIPTEHGRIRLEHYHRYAMVLDVVKEKDVLDVACGEGYGSSFMASVAHSVVGVDISDEAVQHASATYTKSNLTFCQGSAIALDFADASFDVVVSFETIEHLAEQGQMLAEIRRVLRSDGLLVISSPNRPIYSEESRERNEFHVKELDFNEFDELLRTQFPSIQYFGQRMLMGSVIQPLEGGQSSYRAWHDDGSKVEPNAGSLAEPVYFVAVCGASITRLPRIDMSVLYPDKLDLVKHYVGYAKWAQTLNHVVAERDSQIARLTQTIAGQAVVERDAAAALVNLIKNSTSWRITRPLRFFARLARYGLTNEDRQRLTQELRHHYHRLPLPASAKRLVSFTYHKVFGKIIRALRRSTLRVSQFHAPPIKPAAKVEGLPDYIVWGVIDWHFRHQRPQQLVLALADTGRRVFYVSPNLVDDERAGFEIEALDAAGLLFQVKLFVKGAPVIYSSAPGVESISQLRASIGEVLSWANSKQLISLVQHPFWYDVASVLPNSRLVYDCMDHHEGFGNAGETLMQLEKTLFGKSDLTITTSAWLDQAVAEHTRRRALIRNN